METIYQTNLSALPAPPSEWLDDIEREQKENMQDLAAKVMIIREAQKIILPEIYKKLSNHPINQLKECFADYWKWKTNHCQTVTFERVPKYLDCNDFLNSHYHLDHTYDHVPQCYYNDDCQHYRVSRENFKRKQIKDLVRSKSGNVLQWRYERVVYFINEALRCGHKGKRVWEMVDGYKKANYPFLAGSSPTDYLPKATSKH